MAKRIPWDKYETALLVDACTRIMAGEELRKDAITRVSKTLRKRAVDNGIEIDDIFRNESGITLQLVNLEELMKNPSDFSTRNNSKLFKDIVHMYNTDREQFNEILAVVKGNDQQVDVKPYTFREWISNTSDDHRIMVSEQAIYDAEAYAVKKGFIKKSIQEISTLSQTAELAAILKNDKLFRLFHGRQAQGIDQVLKLYVDYLEKGKNSVAVQKTSELQNTCVISDEEVAASEEIEAKLDDKVSNDSELQAGEIYVDIDDLSPEGEKTIHNQTMPGLQEPVNSEATSMLDPERIEGLETKKTGEESRALSEFAELSGLNHKVVSIASDAAELEQNKRMESTLEGFTKWMRANGIVDDAKIKGYCTSIRLTEFYLQEQKPQKWSLFPADLKEAKQAISSLNLDEEFHRRDARFSGKYYIALACFNNYIDNQLSMHNDVIQSNNSHGMVERAESKEEDHLSEAVGHDDPINTYETSVVEEKPKDISEIIYTLKTKRDSYIGSSVAEAFAAFCDHLVVSYPLTMQSLAGAPYNGQGSIVLKKVSINETDVKLCSLNAYVSGGLTDLAAMHYGKWLCKMCNDADPPLTITKRKTESDNITGLNKLQDFEIVKDLAETYPTKADKESTIIVASEDKAGDEEAKLNLFNITSVLQKRYNTRPAASLLEIFKNNQDIPVASINDWAKIVANKGAAQYLISKGVLQQKGYTGSNREKKDLKFVRLNEVTSILLARHAGNPVSNLSSLIKENRDLPVASVNVWTQELFAKTASEYFREKGIIQPVTEKTTEEKFEGAILQIKQFVGKDQIHSLKELNKCGLEVSITTLNNWSKKLFAKTISEYLVEAQILNFNYPELDIKPFNRSLYPCIKDEDKAVGIIDESENEPDEESDGAPAEEPIEEINEDPIGDIELSFFRTIEYLKTRYNVQQQYDNIIESSRNILYKAKNTRKDIIWVCYSKTSINETLYIETEPQYLENMEEDYVGFTRIISKTSRPHLRLFFENYSDIRESLIDMCDSIDLYFEIPNAVKSKQSNGKPFQKQSYNSRVNGSGALLIPDISYLGSKKEGVLKEPILDASFCTFISGNQPNSKSFTSKSAGSQEKEQNKISDLHADSGNDHIKEILKKHFAYGFRFDSVRELMRFRQFAESLGVNLPEEDDQLKQKILASGTVIDDKLFCTEDDLPKILQQIVDEIFDSGISVVYYECLFSEKENVLSSFHISSEELLKEYLKKHVYGYAFSKKFMTRGSKSTEKDAITGELIRIWGDHQVECVDDLNDRLPYIPISNLWRVISGNDLFVSTATGKYLLLDRFRIDAAEEGSILEYVEEACTENGFASLSDVPLGDLEEENYELPLLAIQNAVYKKVLSEKFHLNGRILTKDKPDLDAISLLKEYIQGRDEISFEEVAAKAVEITGTSNRQYAFQALYDEMVRVGHDRFVATRNVSFNVAEIDHLLESFIKDHFGAIRDVTTFVMFPLCGQDWNHYLLESYCYRYSKVYSLRVLQFNDKNAGIIAEKSYTLSYDEMLALELVRSHVDLTESAAGAHFTDTGYMIKSKFGMLPSIVQRAKELER